MNVMNGRNEENLKELFERFLDSEEAERAAEDIRKGEMIVRAYPAPEPGREVIADIKVRVAKAVLRRRANTIRRMVYKAAVAAAVVLLAGVGIRLWLSEKGGVKTEGIMYASLVPSALWESEDITADDSELAVLTAEIEQVESEIGGVQSVETNGNGRSELTELEMELTEINSDFWKG